MEVLNVGMPLNKISFDNEVKATIEFEGIKINIGLTGLDSIIPNIKRGIQCSNGSMSLFHSRDLAFALERLREEMRTQA